MENNVGFHGKACNPEEYAKAVAELIGGGDDEPAGDEDATAEEAEG